MHNSKNETFMLYTFPINYFLIFSPLFLLNLHFTFTFATNKIFSLSNYFFIYIFCVYFFKDIFVYL